MNRVSRREFLIQTGTVLGAAAFLPALVECGGTQAPTGGTGASTLEDAAKKEGGHLSLYIFDADEGKLFGDGFQSQYSWATVDVTGQPDVQIATKYLTEFQAGAYVADVLHIVPTHIPPLKAANALASVTLPNDSLISPDLQDPTGYRHDLFLSIYCLVYNPGLTSAPPTDLFLLADPKYKGQIVVDNPVHLANSGPVFASRRPLWGDAKWTQWLQGLAANKLFFATDMGASYDSVVRGERPFGLTTYHSIYAQPAGAPAKAVFFQNPFVSAFPALISSKAPHPNTARLFVNWLLSDNGEQVSVKRGQTPSTSIKSALSLSTLIPPGSGKLISATSDTAYLADPESYRKIYMQYWSG